MITCAWNSIYLFIFTESLSFCIQHKWKCEHFSFKMQTKKRNNKKGKLKDKKHVHWEMYTHAYKINVNEKDFCNKMHGCGKFYDWILKI